MTDWAAVTLGGVASIDRTVVDPAEVDPSTLYIGLENVEKGGKIVGVRTVGEAELSSIKFQFTDRHVLFGKLRPYLAKIARPSFDGVCSTDILPILPGPQLDRSYLAHFLRLPESIALATVRATGANLPRISPKDLASFEIQVPALEEQRRIGEILDQADELLAKRYRSIALFDELAQSIFLDTFGDPSTNPKNWPVTLLDKVIINGPQNGLYKPASSYGAGVPIVRIDAFYRGVITKMNSLKRLQVSEVELRRWMLHPGDVLINRVNSLDYLGKSALIPSLSEPTVFESNMMRLSVDENILHPRFLIQVLQSAYVRSQILSRAKNAVNQSSINQSDVRSLEIFVPPRERQEKYVTDLKQIDCLGEAALWNAAMLGNLFSSLQDRVFREKS